MEQLLSETKIINDQQTRGRLDTMVVDLSDFSTIRPGVQRFLRREKRLDGLVHNAAVMSAPTGSKDKQVCSSMQVVELRQADDINRAMI